MTDHDEKTFKQTQEALKQLADTIRPFEQVIKTFNSRTFVYDTAEGKCIGKGLYRVPETAIQILEVFPNCTSIGHSHIESEYLICFEGSFTIEFDKGEIKEFNVGDLIMIEPNVIHTFRSEKGCKAIAISIPASKTFPDGSEQ